MSETPLELGSDLLFVSALCGVALSARVESGDTVEGGRPPPTGRIDPPCGRSTMIDRDRITTCRRPPAGSREGTSAQGFPAVPPSC